MMESMINLRPWLESQSNNPSSITEAKSSKNGYPPMGTDLAAYAAPYICRLLRLMPRLPAAALPPSPAAPAPAAAIALAL